MIMPSDECYGTLLMISQHCFRWWLGAVRHHAISWTNVDPDLCHHMTSLGCNELKGSPLIHFVKKYSKYRSDIMCFCEFKEWSYSIFATHIMQYHVVIDCVIMGPDCMSNISTNKPVTINKNPKFKKKNKSALLSSSTPFWNKHASNYMNNFLFDIIETSIIMHWFWLFLPIMLKVKVGSKTFV